MCSECYGAIGDIKSYCPFLAGLYMQEGVKKRTDKTDVSSVSSSPGGGIPIITNYEFTYNAIS
jgi:hypothetical protein